MFGTSGAPAVCACAPTDIATAAAPSTETSHFLLITLLSSRVDQTRNARAKLRTRTFRRRSRQWKTAAWERNAGARVAEMQRASSSSVTNSLRLREGFERGSDRLGDRHAGRDALHRSGRFFVAVAERDECIHHVGRGLRTGRRGRFGKLALE